jgi:hypothetical protein
MMIHRGAVTLAIAALLASGSETAALAADAPQPAAPQTTAPQTTAPQTTAPQTTAPQTAAPPTGAQQTTAPAQVTSGALPGGGQNPPPPGQQNWTVVTDPGQALLRPITCALPLLPSPVPGGGVEIVFDHTFTAELGRHGVTMQAVAPAYSRPSATFDLVTPLDPAEGTATNLCYSGVTIPGGASYSGAGGAPSLTFTGLIASLSPAGLYVRASTQGQPGQPFEFATFSAADVAPDGQITLGPFPSAGIRGLKLYLTPAGAQELNSTFGTQLQAGDVVGTVNFNFELLPVGGDYTPR